MTRFFSPYQLNPFDVNPLRDILVSQVDFERLRADCRIDLFIAATRVSTGTLRLFRTKEITLEALLASACLPAVHHSIEIDGEAYWDGGLTANPPLFPLLENCLADDLIMVLLHPAPATATPSSADEISRRLTEIGFTAGFFAEVQGLALAKRQAERGWFSLGRLQRKLRRSHTHLIDSREFMSRLSTLSKANTHSSFIAALREEGRNRAELWLENNFHLIGAKSSCSLDEILR
jgi:NTE family protein